MKMKMKLIVSFVLLVSSLAIQPVMAAGSVQHSAKASEHAVKSIGHTAVAGSKLVFDNLVKRHV